MKVQTYEKTYKVLDVTPKTWSQLKKVILGGLKKSVWYYEKDKVINLNLKQIDYIYHKQAFFEEEGDTSWVYIERGVVVIGNEEIVVDIKDYKRILRYTVKFFDKELAKELKKRDMI